MVHFHENTIINVSAFVSITGGLIGYFGGRATQVLVPSVSPVGYGLAFGLTPWTGLGIWAFLSTVNKSNDLANLILSIFGSYLSSVAIANLLGCDVTLIGPFMGTISLAGSLVVIGLVAIPLIITGGIIYWAIGRR